MRAKPRRTALNASPFAFQGAGAAGPPTDARMPRQYSPDKVGNDASARPWERSRHGLRRRAAAAVRRASARRCRVPQNWGVPAGFDTEGFLSAAKRNFTTLQAAWDRSDIATLRSMMTDSMLDEIRTQLDEREAHRGDQPQPDRCGHDRGAAAGHRGPGRWPTWPAWSSPA